MSIIKYTIQFAANADYNCGAYGAGTYQNNVCGQTTTPGGGPLDGLANTGYDVLLPIFLAISLIAAAGIMLAKRYLRKRRQNREFSVQSSNN